jgi:hypothetical protein
MKIRKTGKIIISILSLGVLSISLFQCFTWQSPGTNSKGAYCLHPENTEDQLQNTSPNLIMNTEKGMVFKVKFIKNADQKCVNPHFPVIFINTDTPHDGWVHIVYTDSDNPKLKKFIDYDPESTKAPFYSNLQHFYDAPLWTYSLLLKKPMFWKGHAFAVQVDRHNKTIKCIGGIEWGFKLHFAKLRPVAITPKLLNEKAWHQAWDLLKEKLPGYRQIQ